MSDLNPYEEGLAIDLAKANDRIEELETLIKELFRLLDITEQTDEGRVFRPNRIVSYRALDAEKLEKVLSDLKAMIGETDE